MLHHYYLLIPEFSEQIKCLQTIQMPIKKTDFDAALQNYFEMIKGSEAVFPSQLRIATVYLPDIN